MKTNATVSKRFSEMLGNSINKYNSRSIETSKVIEELIQLAKRYQTRTTTRKIRPEFR